MFSKVTLSIRESAINIWMIDAATGDMEPLTNDGADSRPHGRLMEAGLGPENLDTTGDGRITVNDSLDMYILDLDTRTEKIVANTPAFDDFSFAWSPDGGQDRLYQCAPGR